MQLLLSWKIVSCLDMLTTVQRAGEHTQEDPWTKQESSGKVSLS